MKKQSQYIFLPADKPSNIYLTKDGVLHLGTLSGSSTPHTFNQHIYILSDDEIKEGEWFYSVTGFTKPLIEKAIMNLSKAEHIKKIIATTNRELEISGRHTDNRGDGATLDYIGHHIHKLPNISQSDIEYIITLYNRMNLETAPGLLASTTNEYNPKRFTSKDILTAIEMAREEKYSGGFKYDEIEIFQSLTKEQPKTDTVMVEYEEINMPSQGHGTISHIKIKLKTKDGCILITKG